MVNDKDKSINDFYREENVETKSSGLGSSLVHTVLSGLGMTEPLGTFADILDTGLYGIEGDKEGFKSSLPALIPGFGAVAGFAKFNKKAKDLEKFLDKQGLTGKARENVKGLYQYIWKLNRANKKHTKELSRARDKQKQLDMAEDEVMQGLAEYKGGKDPEAWGLLMQMLGKIKRRN